ncbi:MAG TPA: DUF2075 domain-containing protein [Pyrinomonadaceae bacterium]|nr:DUF2075 domain-containing protein [Pyrinomonadaceae bacterium]
MPAYYASTLLDFTNDETNRVVGILTTKSADSGFINLKQRQTKAWQKQVDDLMTSCASLISDEADAVHWTILLEYPIPRRQKRIDAVLLARDLIFCIEFKTKAKVHNLQAQKQAEDYALDLRDFHSESRGRRIVPIAVASDAESVGQKSDGFFYDLVRPALMANARGLSQTILGAYQSQTDLNELPIDPRAWNESAYRPVPTIIEAAEALYAGHDVSDIAHSHAGDENLELTSQRIIELVKRAQERREKIACFVTGIPGAGKTLAGLNVVHNPALRREGRPPGVFLSGNGPLVKVIRTAIERDFKRRTDDGNPKRTTGTFIQNIHEFVRVESERSDPPSENVIVFDEAQRAWNAEHNARKNDDERSEPEIVLSIMDRNEWSVVVALVGGGQEIHTGEAGLAEWGRTLREKFPLWRIAVSPEALHGGTSVAGHKLFEGEKPDSIICEDRAFHLDTARRSFRAQQVTEWVEAVLRGDANAAANIAQTLTEFPMVLTRSLEAARKWLHGRTLGLRRCGLVASSGGLRLRAEGLELSSGFRQTSGLYVNWFLNDPTDIRSSNQLEVAASEFECQGLELDWVGLCWSGDLTFDPKSGEWIKRVFRGNNWNDVPNEIDQRYLINKYRVLLTRAREGMIIWVPEGDSNDSTRPHEWFDSVYDLLVACGLKSASG